MGSYYFLDEHRNPASTFTKKKHQKKSSISPTKTPAMPQRFSCKKYLGTGKKLSVSKNKLKSSKQCKKHASKSDKVIMNAPIDDITRMSLPLKNNPAKSTKDSSYNYKFPKNAKVDDIGYMSVMDRMKYDCKYKWKDYFLCSMWYKIIVYISFITSHFL